MLHWICDCCNERQCVADGGDEQGTIVAGPGGLTIDPNIQYQIRADTGQGQWLLYGMCVVKCCRVLEWTSHYTYVQITTISTAILLASNPRIRLFIKQLQDDSAQYSSSGHCKKVTMGHVLYQYIIYVSLFRVDRKHGK